MMSQLNFLQLKKTFGQITVKQQNAKLELASLFYKQWRCEKFQKGGAVISTLFSSVFFSAEQI